MNIENNFDPKEQQQNPDDDRNQERSSMNEDEQPTLPPDMEEDVDEDIQMGDEYDYDPMADYGTSGEKYGWYNGFSDDAIDDAFEGDPMNTWNVD